jgi:hypothetical protein
MRQAIVVIEKVLKAVWGMVKSLLCMDCLFRELDVEVVLDVGNELGY